MNIEGRATAKGVPKGGQPQKESLREGNHEGCPYQTFSLLAFFNNSITSSSLTWVKLL